jgi:uncharacterized small protein (DUF1192 family)
MVHFYLSEDAFLHLFKNAHYKSTFKIMDPATIGLLISIAPTVLDLLFGSGHHLNTPLLEKTPMYGYGYSMDGYPLEGLGCRRPRAQRTVTTIYRDPEVREKYFRYVVFNRAITAENPWVKFLRENNYYQKISDLLKETRVKYRQANPFKPTKKNIEALQKHIARLKTELSVLQDDALRQKMLPEFRDKFGETADMTPYIDAKIKKLQEEINRLSKYLVLAEAKK